MRNLVVLNTARLRSAVLAAAVACPTAQSSLAAQSVSDPWAPGTSVDPWPLIEHLQRWGVGPQPEPDWQAVIADGDPLVRAAAAAALGRTPRPDRRGLLEPLLADRVRLVRRTAQWAAMQFGDVIPSALADDVLRDVGAEDHERPEADPGLLRLLRRWVPPTVIGSGPPQRRAWLAERGRGPLPPLKAQVNYGPAVLAGGWVAAARSQWDADEIVELTARVVTGAASLPGSIGLARRLVPFDPFGAPDRRGPPWSSESTGPTVTVRVVGGDGTGVLQLPPASDRVVRLAFDLAEVPPDVYTFSFGNPVFLRVRRGDAMEKRAAKAAAEVLTSPEALDRVARLRVLAAAPALRERFARNLETYGFGFNAYRDAMVLARLPDRAAAELVIPPLLASAAIRDPWTGQRPDLGRLFRTGFGGAARDILRPLLSDWRLALQFDWGDALVSILGDRDWTGVPALDAARLEVLAELPRDRDVDSGTHAQRRRLHERNLLWAVLTATAAEYPRAAGANLARLSRPGDMTSQLRMVTAALGTAETERLVQAIWAALAGGGPDKDAARAALAQEATALGVTLVQPQPAR